MFSTPKKGTTPPNTNAPARMKMQNSTTHKVLVFSSEGTAIAMGSDSTAKRLNFNGMKADNQSSNNINAISSSFARITVK